MEISNILATLGSILLIISYLPQIKSLYKTKNAEGMSISFWVILISGMLLLTLNLIINNSPISVLLPQFINVGLAIVVLLQILYCRRKQPCIKQEKPQLIFTHGTLAAGKSLALLNANKDYISKGKDTLLLKPNIDTRSEGGFIESRSGDNARCIDISAKDDIELIYLKNNSPSVVLVDEAQFLTSQQVLELRKLVDGYNVSVLAYGLKNTFKPNELFEGSKALLYYADKIEEIKNTCMVENCDKEATMNLRIINNTPVYDGETVSIGDVEGEERYMCVCAEHYRKPKL